MQVDNSYESAFTLLFSYLHLWLNVVLKPLAKEFSPDSLLKRLRLDDLHKASVGTL